MRFRLFLAITAAALAAPLAGAGAAPQALRLAGAEHLSMVSQRG